ncbi:glycosyltransferase [Cyanobium sp. N.Huapi 1H5]|uniref:glycosyltransferase family 2 protein n=1 Tax=Cyanobium sp. N.Huapi 1H5 TaxID=2823719 RepID=UPI0020CC5950|nr:glycosyltransferase [Cyanobium sp. N.Huapi 1H5]MCP9837704.1 glycosyltransferase [Cyanobium sp. N.Huapi 1H5]
MSATPPPGPATGTTPPDGAATGLTLIVPTLDSHLLLPRLVNSLQRQSWPHWKVLFIDGPSGAEHRAWLEALCHRDHRFRWQPQDPALPGIFGAMNQGFREAPPEDWLLFWGSDDWAPSRTVLEEAMEATQRGPRGGQPPDLVVCSGRYAGKGPDGATRLGRRTAFSSCRAFRLSLFLGSTPPHQATLIGPGARRRLDHYAEPFRLSADLDYFLRLSTSRDLTAKSLDLELVHMGEAGASGQQTGRRLEEVTLAYRRAFGWLWGLPFGLRYVRRLWSRRPGAGRRRKPAGQAR